MSQAFIKKNIKLSIEFDRYMAQHPELYETIPNNAYLIITIEGDRAFNADSLALVRNPKRKKIVEAHKAGSSWSLRPLKLQTA